MHRGEIPSTTMRALALTYGLVSWLLFVAVFLYLIGFLGNWLVPKSVDTAFDGSSRAAALVNVALLLLFAVAHSVMARPAFKRWWTQFIPTPIERSTYVLVNSLLLVLLFWGWQPLPSIVWDIGSPLGRWLLYAIFWLGWAVVLASTFLIDHFELFGLRQVYLFASGRTERPIDFKTPGLYRYVRHPMMLGFLMAFWATPTMTTGHLLFALTMTAYVLVALRLEERDLEEIFGEKYRMYRQRVGMLLPLQWFTKSGGTRSQGPMQGTHARGMFKGS